MHREEDNPVSAPGVDGIVPLVAIDLGQQPKSVKGSPQLQLADWPCELGDSS